MTTGERRTFRTRTKGGRAATIGTAMLVLLGGTALSPWARTSSAAGAPYTSTLANGNDDMKSSWYPNESALTPGLVTGGTFGQLWDAQLDPPNDGFPNADQLYGQPLVYVNPGTGAATVVVASEANQLYGFDAATGQRRYRVSLGQPFDPGTVPCPDLVPRIGITGTPAIDTATGTSYVFSKQTVGGVTSYVAYGYDAETGAIAWSTPIAGAAQNAPTVSFDARLELQRPGLLINQGVLYAAFGGHCDIGNYRGWIVGIDLATHNIVTMWSAQPAGTAGGGIWQSGGGIMSDGPGRLFVTTGNSLTGGPTNATPPIASGNVPAVVGQSVVRLEVQADHTLRPASFFMPYDAVNLDTYDLDFGSSGPVAVPSEALPAGAQSAPVLVAIGKEGYVYLLNRDALGGYKQGAGGGDLAVSRVGPDGGVWSKPAVWPGESADGGYVYVVTSSSAADLWNNEGFLNTYKIATAAGGTPALQKVASSADTYSFGSGSPIVTSAGTTPGTGIAWTVWPGSYGIGAELRAYRAVPDGATMPLLGRWPVGYSSKFASPVASGNRIFVGTRDGHLLAFGSPVDQPLAASTPVFPNTVTGQASTVDVTVTANVAATIGSATSSSGAFVVGSPSVALPAPVAAGASISIPITFSPSAAGPLAGQVIVATSVGPLTIPVHGRGVAPSGQLSVSPPAVSLGGSPVGETISSSFTLANVGASNLTITDLTAPDQPFSRAAVTLPYTLAPGASLLVQLGFAPTAAGAFQAAVTVTSDGGTVSIPITASSATLGHRTLAPDALVFPDTLVGGHRDRGFTLGNDGGSAYTVSISKAPGSGQFVGNGAALPEGSLVAAGSLRVLPVRFAPTAAGPQLDGWDLSTTEGSGRTNLSVSGTAVASVKLPAPTPGSGWTTNGSATAAADGSLQLTADAVGQTGTAWYATPVTTGHVEAHFDAFLDGTSGQAGEGMTFAIADADQASATGVGAPGEGLGFAASGNGLAVALVAHDTPTDQPDLVGVMMTTPGGARQWLAPPVSLSPALHADVPGGRPVPVDVWIDRATDGTAAITVLVDGTPVVVGLAAPVPQRAYLGFTAATTADAAERHAVGAAPTILVDGLAAATCPDTVNGWKGEYFANVDLTGSPVACRDDALVSYDWADGSPAPAVPADNFSARWTKTIATGARSYTFTTGSDDGSRLYIDGRLVLNAWKVQTYTPRSTRVLLTSGFHTIVYEYFDTSGPARVLLGIR